MVATGLTRGRQTKRKVRIRGGNRDAEEERVKEYGQTHGEKQCSFRRVSVVERKMGN